MKSRWELKAKCDCGWSSRFWCVNKRYAQDEQKKYHYCPVCSKAYRLELVDNREEIKNGE